MHVRSDERIKRGSVLRNYVYLPPTPLHAYTAQKTRPFALQQVISRSHWAEIFLTGDAGLYFQYTAVALECDLFPSAAWGAAGGGVSPVGAAVRWWAAGA